MRLIALEPVHGVQVGQTFEVDGSDACRLITYGFASPADPGPEESGLGPSRRRPRSKDAVLAAELRTGSARGTSTGRGPRSHEPSR